MEMYENACFSIVIQEERTKNWNLPKGTENEKTVFYDGAATEN